MTTSLQTLKVIQGPAGARGPAGPAGPAGPPGAGVFGTMASQNASAVAITGGTITGLPTPTNPSDAVTKSYADGLGGGSTNSWKTSVVAATTAAGTLATSFANGQTIDGIALATGNRILVKNQATGSENGIYTVNASGAPTRSTDANTGALLINAAVFVQSGTVNVTKAFVCTNSAAITIGSTSVVFGAFGTVIGALLAANNLSDLNNAGTARTNLGLGSMAVKNSNDITDIQLNASSTSITTLEIVTTFLNNVAGTEASKTLFKNYVAGAQTTSLDVRGNQTLFPIGTTAVPGIAFQGFGDTGYTYESAFTRHSCSIGGTQVYFLTGSAFTMNSGASVLQALDVFIRRNGGTGYTEIGQVAGRDIVLQAQTTSALATNATGGFVQIPTCAGLPTGTVGTLYGGHTALVTDTTNGRLMSYYGSAWHPDAGTFINSQFLTAGTTYTPTAGTTRAIVECWPGGSAGGGTPATGAAQAAAGGGGAAGAPAVRLYTGLGAGPYTIAIGAGGTGASGAGGNAGGNTTFTDGTTLLTAAGASGGGLGSLASTTVTTSALGGISNGPTNSQLANTAGEPGQPGIAITGTTPYPVGGTGGSSPWGGGGRGQGGATTTGQAAIGYSSGGAGASANASQAAQTGGAGTQGFIRITEYA